MMTLTIAGLYRYNDHIFDGLIDNLPKKSKLPDYLVYNDTIPEINPEILIYQLVHECRDFEVSIPDAEYMQHSILWWAYKNSIIWQQLYETICYKYTPYWNKDSKTTEDITEETGKDGTESGTSTDGSTRTTTGSADRSGTETGSENRTTKNTGTQANAHTGTDTMTRSLSDAESGTERVSGTGTKDATEVTTPETTVTEKVAGFNAETLVNNAKTENGGRSTLTTDEDTTENETTTFGKTIAHTGTEAMQHGETVTRTDNLTETETGSHEKNTTGSEQTTEREVYSRNGSTSGSSHESGTLDRGRTMVEQGNIGVTATQDLIQAQRELVTFDLYQVIIDSFKHEFCVLIY